MKSYLILFFIVLVPQAFFWPHWDWIGEAMVSIISSAALVGIINSLYLEYKLKTQARTYNTSTTTVSREAGSR